mmetsp:Transcript_10611/g.39553  ORF Transcript_10611/g.39553 Transcript_10611/m.39553 type:complete len:524 (-) Transcript_10611:1452-3023(-)|eukprot:CAMPEP_0117439018 /NCGR_PEP_ID=MMETSP0759-20121206/2353_1 /TAXON_ID=63605 /ORGANISM="Percolomonas cosmopolitus, Strain WS" /LENGTH=523 /DNA_ID=CAMNT_0005230729 /DNA_START=316 /DNA_END=1887 /DNA_ORIENTATION=-
MNPYRKRKNSAHSSAVTKYQPQVQFQDPYEVKLGLTPNRQEIDLDSSKQYIKRLQSRQSPTPNAATGVNYEYLRSNQIPVERVRFHTAKKRSTRSSRSPNSRATSPSKRAHSALSFYTSGNLSGEYSITVDDGQDEVMYMGDRTETQQFGSAIDADDSASADEDQYFGLTRSFLKDQDSIQKVTKRISSASTTRRRRLNGTTTDVMSIAAGSGAVSTSMRSISSSKPSSMNPVAQVLPSNTKIHLLEERRKLKSALSNLASSHASDPNASASLSITPQQHIHQSFHKIVSDIESEITENKKVLHSRKHGFKRHFRNTTFDSHDAKQNRLNDKLYRAAREQEKRDRQEKELIAIMKAKRRRERQRKSFKMQKQKNFLKRVKSYEPRVLEQLADVLDPVLDSDIEVSDIDFMSPFGSTPNGMRSRSTPASRPQSSFGTSRRVHKYPTHPHGVMRSQTPDISSATSRSRPQSGASHRTRSRPRSRLHSALERASSGFEYEESLSTSNEKDLHELDRMDRRLQQGMY